MNMFVPHLLFGYAWRVHFPQFLRCSHLRADRESLYSMNFFSYLSCDLALLRGKVGCRPGAFILYYPCRYLSILSMVTFLAYYDSFQNAQLEVSLPMSICHHALITLHRHARDRCSRTSARYVDILSPPKVFTDMLDTRRRLPSRSVLRSAFLRSACRLFGPHNCPLPRTKSSSDAPCTRTGIFPSSSS